MKLLPGQILVMGPDHTQAHLHSTRAPTDSVWSTSYKIERMVVGGCGVSQPKSFVYMSPVEIRLLLTSREKWIFNSHGVILTLIIHWFESRPR